MGGERGRVFEEIGKRVFEEIGVWEERGGACLRSQRREGGVC